MLDLYDLTRPQLAALFNAWGFSAAHEARVWRYLYGERVAAVAEMTALPRALHQRLLAETRLTELACRAATPGDEGLSTKCLLQLADGRQVETVLMRYRERVTACLSSQVGCALGCVFCATGQMGFVRNLTTGEIVAQALYAQRLLPRHQRLTNLVLMGMGEPLHNYDAVMQALEILRDPSSLAIRAKRITVSTVGIVPGILRLADEARPYSLAVSLHAADQAERAAMIPAARAWPLAELLPACRYYARKLERKILFEWTLIAGTNDSADHARQLATLLRGLPAQVNLIPLNRTPGYDGAPGDDAAIGRFHAILQEQGLPCSVRQRRGIAIDAGCGQLATAYVRRGPARHEAGVAF